MSYPLNQATSIGYVQLKVKDLNRSITFYKEVIGLSILVQEAETVSLTVDGVHPLLVLEQHQEAVAKPRHTTGLYHFAILVPDRRSLGQSLLHLIESKYPLSGASDHQFSEALYLSDPDGNGIEIYADRPREQWTRDSAGQFATMSDPMDVQGVLADAGEHVWRGLPLGTVMGHVHLHVANIQKSKEFYVDILGFDATIYYGDQALFVSAGGYHHHIGLNTWAGAGAPTPPEGSVGLRFFTIVVPNKGDLSGIENELKSAGIPTDRRYGGVFVKDPAGNGIVLVVATN
ncbi:catechol 2,3-dioxygenase [Paenibacillus sp. DS2015]|uniref:VOC family protein n=1 Tax=Paenibacillus sp. DS2015 TaxID=3373917 RepID=UPI003D219CF3